jgi:perosamine synthetase
MKIGRTLPPAAALRTWADLGHGVAALFASRHSIRALEDDIRRYFGVAHVFLLSSGSAALAVTLAALKSLSRRTEVIIPAYTCFSVPAAVLKAGLRPAPCDISASTFDFDHTLLEPMLGADTLCVVAHHLFGLPADIERIRSLCKARGVFVVEDAAQAMGAQSHGHPLGTLGDVGIFSLGRGKNITCGSGGIIVTSSDQIAEAIGREYQQLRAPSFAGDLSEIIRLLLMTILIRPRLYWIPAALPFLGLGRTIFPKRIPLARLSRMKAGLLRDWRQRLTRANQGRAETSSYFSRQLGVRAAQDASPPCLRFPIVAASAETRDVIYSRARRRGLGISPAYPTPVDAIPEMRLACSGRQFPVARGVAAKLLTLPTHHLLSDADKNAIAALCRDLPAA